MNTKETKNLEAKLLEEKKDLENELANIAKSEPQNRGGWEPTAGAIEIDAADENEVADKLEELEDNAGIATQLENQLIEVNAALERMKSGKYGICLKCGKPIEKEILEANPSAKISIKHSHK